MVDTLGSRLAPLNDTEIGVYDAAGNRIATNDDFYGRLSRLTFGAGGVADLPAGTYYVGARCI